MPSFFFAASGRHHHLVGQFVQQVAHSGPGAAIAHAFANGTIFAYFVMVAVCLLMLRILLGPRRKRGS